MTQVNSVSFIVRILFMQKRNQGKKIKENDICDKQYIDFFI